MTTLPPLMVRWACPGCGARNELDCTSYYFSNPSVGPHAPFKVFPLVCSCAVKGEAHVRLVDFLRQPLYVVREVTTHFPGHWGVRAVF